MDRDLVLGDLVVARFPQHLPPGREQEDVRPAVVVGLAELLGEPRYPLLMLAPLTTDHGQAWAIRSPALYPRLTSRIAGLRADSVVLLDQLRALDEARMAGYLGALPEEAYEPIKEGLRRMLGLAGWPARL